ncbi:MAG: alcohol dehydrogenase catalytic domain-containing protein, partial [Gaiellaceae bacterium]
MRAWELAEFGLENLKLVERPEPEPAAGQVKLRVKAASLNSRDLQVIYNKYDPNQRLPIVPVSDGVGEVVAVGEGVTRVAVGDRVVGA